MQWERNGRLEGWRDGQARNSTASWPPAAGWGPRPGPGVGSAAWHIHVTTVGCWQPHFHRMNPYGDVHKFRMSLWTEHFKHMESTFIHPGTIECVQKVKEYASYNWQMYTGPDGSVTPGQMLPYPLDVQQNGDLRYLSNFETFPDFPPGSKIMGTLSSFIPQKVTT